MIKNVKLVQELEIFDITNRGTLPELVEYLTTENSSGECSLIYLMIGTNGE